MFNFKKEAKKQPSQCEIILKYMRSHKGITGKQAYRVAHSMNLAQRIYDLRQRGNEIEDDWVIEKGDDGKKYRVKQYRLVK